VQIKRELSEFRRVYAFRVAPVPYRDRTASVRAVHADPLPLLDVRVPPSRARRRSCFACLSARHPSLSIPTRLTSRDAAPTTSRFASRDEPTLPSTLRVTPDAILPVGTVVDASHFLAGQYVDVQGKTIGKGFQGPMKRWGFAGLPATHGTTKKHRAHGSIGNSQDPGRVWKGKKMAGQMGNRTRTVQSCFVYKVDPERNLIYVVGQVPGKRGNFVRVKDALRKGDPTGCVPEGAPYPAWGFGAFESLKEKPSAAVTAAMPSPFPIQESSQEVAG
jgi:50S ribosomal protein uL3